MKIPCREIADIIEKSLHKEVTTLKEKHIQPKLVTFLLEPTPEQQSYVAIKERIGASLGIDFELIVPKQIPSQQEANDIIRKYAEDKNTSGIIIQLPLPKDINAQELYSMMPVEKEIEGHVTSTYFQFPLSLAVLTGIKYIYLLNQRHSGLDPESNIEILNRVQDDVKVIDQSLVNFNQDREFFASALRNKKIVIAGRGPTGGKPIGKALQALDVSFEMTHSQTPNADELYKEADIIITASGRKIIHAGNIKKGVVLLNVGLRKEGEELKGDYDEDEIADIASYYTSTPGGLGPLDVLYLYKNVIEAAKLV